MSTNPRNFVAAAYARVARLRRRGVFAALLVVLGVVAWLPSLTWADTGKLAPRQNRVISPELVDHARQQVDEIVQQIGQDDSPATREKIVRAILNDIKRDGERVPEDWGIESSIALYDELDRRFGNDESPAVRALVAEALVDKGRSVRAGSYWENFYRKRRPYPEEAMAIFDDIERRFGQDTHSAVRVQYVRSLVEIGYTWSEEKNLDVALAAYDDVIARFGKDKVPGVRAQVVRTFRLKGNAWRGHVDSEKVEVLMDKFQQDFPEFDPPDAKLKALLFDKCQKLQTGKKSPDNRDYSNGIEVWFARSNNYSSRAKIVWKFFNHCSNLNLDEIYAIFDEADHRYSKDRAPEVRKELTWTLFSKGHIALEYKDSQTAIAVYDDLNRRFGKKDLALRKSIAHELLSRGFYDQVVQWFWQDKDPDIKREVIQALVKPGDRLRDEGKFDAAIAVYDEVVRRFGKKGQVEYVLDKKGIILRQQGELEAAIEVYDDIARRMGPANTYYAALALVRKGEILVQQGKFKEAIALYDEVEQRFGKEASYPSIRDLVRKAAEARAAASGRLSSQ
ncbi:hypothetical protein AGMMS50225_28390 [Betaproteobacteria bacterium]|nr:hypothetical protein AGMMS50225_28390 [Betaproteobacteria bacterium]